MKFRDHVVDRQTIRDWRTGIGLTQAAMADLMGVPLRTYEDIEGGKVAVRQIHVNAACMALIEFAAENGGASTIPVEIADLARRASA